MKKLFVSISAVLVSGIIASAAKPVFSGALDLTSKYMWRGTECASGATLFPSASLEIGGLSFSAWGAYALDSSVSEIDLSIGYTLGNFTLGITDYYYPSAYGLDDSFFNFKPAETGHTLEGTLTYAPEAFPLTLMWSTMFYGADKDADGKNRFSSYFEAAYCFDLEDAGSLTLTAGASILKGMYSDKPFSVINLAATYGKTIELDKVSFPLSVSYIVNPYLDKTFLTASVGIAF